jgi:uridine kinase
MAATYVVGISGGSGSGKTSFVRALREKLGDQATFISQDDYYFPMETQAVDDKGVHNFDLPTSIDSATMAKEIRQVLAGETVQRQEYTFETVYRDDQEAEGKNEQCKHGTYY